jgi:hypothetical protein
VRWNKGVELKVDGNNGGPWSRGLASSWVGLGPLKAFETTDHYRYPVPIYLH